MVRAQRGLKSVLYLYVGALGSYVPVQLWAFMYMISLYLYCLCRYRDPATDRSLVHGISPNVCAASRQILALGCHSAIQREKKRQYSQLIQYYDRCDI
jgi:hypothetical protein